MSAHAAAANNLAAMVEECPTRLPKFEFRCKQKGCQHSDELTNWAWMTQDAKVLWSKILDENSNPGVNEGNSCYVTCPSCHTPCLQCRHCRSNILVNNNRMLQKQKRSPEGYMWQHLKQSHQITKKGDVGSKRDNSEQDQDQDQDDAEANKRRKEDSSEEAFGFGGQSDNLFEEEPGEENDSCCGYSTEGDDDDLDDMFLLGEGGMQVQYSMMETKMIEERESERDWLEQSGLDLQFLEEGGEEDGIQGQSHISTQTALDWQEGVHSLSSFGFLDFGTEEEKSKGRARHTPSQVQLFFYQTYVGMTKSNGKDRSGGFAGLVYRANVGNRNAMHQVSDAKEAHQMFLLLYLLLELSGPNQKRLIEYQNGIFRLYRVHEGEQSVRTYFPTNMKEVRRMILEGAHSILRNFPCPRTYSIGNHACVSLKEVIHLAAGFGANFKFCYDSKSKQQNRDGLNGTRAAHNLVHDVVNGMKEKGISDSVIVETSIGWLYLWSDSFLRCFIKQKDNSVWILTVTLCPPEREKSTGTYTYVLAMGKSSEDHTPVIEHYLEQVQEVALGFECYSGHSNEVRRVAFGMLNYNADRPERQGILNTRKEGTWGKISGWTACVSEQKFPACGGCYRRTLRRMSGNDSGGDTECSPCKKCFNWSLDANDPRQRTAPAGKGYPGRQEDDDGAPAGREPGQSHLGPVKLSNEFLKKAATFGYKKRLRNKWSKPQLFAYLRTCNINDDRITKIEERAVCDRLNNRESQPWEYMPKAWAYNLFEGFRLPDLPLHGLGHGIIPDTMDITHQIFKQNDRFQRYCSFANRTLIDVGSMRLDYCKTKVLPKAAWVGENSMAYMRLLPYLYGMFLSRVGLKKNASLKVQETVANLRCLLNALQALMSVLMSRVHVDRDTIDNHIKVLMCAADRLHRRYGCLGRDSNGGKAQRDLIASLPLDDLVTILDDFGMDTLGNSKNMRKAIAGIKKTDLAARCVNHGVSMTRADGTGGQATKVDLQVALFSHLLKRNIRKGNTSADTSEQDEEAEEGRAEEQNSSEKEKLCWNKGNWLSFLVNIAAQIEFRGPLPWTW